MLSELRPKAVPLALILSSFVAASRIGGAAQQYVLAAHKIDPVLAPTVMFGRTPARGGKGEITQPDVFRRMLGDDSPLQGGEGEPPVYHLK